MMTYGWLGHHRGMKGPWFVGVLSNVYRVYIAMCLPLLLALKGTVHFKLNFHQLNELPSFKALVTFPLIHMAILESHSGKGVPLGGNLSRPTVHPVLTRDLSAGICIQADSFKN